VGQTVQLRLNQRDQFFESLLVSIPPVAEELRDLSLGRRGTNHKPPLLFVSCFCLDVSCRKKFFLSMVVFGRHFAL
jgi:hypothetical protein